MLDAAVLEVAKNPLTGEEKRGDLAGVFVHKFKLNNQEALLAYKSQPDKKTSVEVVLLSVGPHENLYVQLKRAK